MQSSQNSENNSLLIFSKFKILLTAQYIAISNIEMKKIVNESNEKSNAM